MGQTEGWIRRKKRVTGVRTLPCRYSSPASTSRVYLRMTPSSSSPNRFTCPDPVPHPPPLPNLFLPYPLSPHEHVSALPVLLRCGRQKRAGSGRAGPYGTLGAGRPAPTVPRRRRAAEAWPEDSPGDRRALHAG